MPSGLPSRPVTSVKTRTTSTCVPSLSHWLMLPQRTRSNAHDAPSRWTGRGIVRDAFRVSDRGGGQCLAGLYGLADAGDDRGDTQRLEDHLAGHTGLAQGVLVRFQAVLAAVDRRHRERPQLEIGLVDARIADDLHAQSGPQVVVPTLEE